MGKWRFSLKKLAVAQFFVLVLLAQPLRANSTGPQHPRLLSAESTTCVTCHGDTTENRQSVHAPAQDDCAVCHDVSISNEGTQIALLESEPGLCLGCHDAQAAGAEGSLSTPHLPVTDSCLSCHDPHGSDQPMLLSSNPTELCNSCHAVEDYGPKHGGQITEVTDCARCHQPHGSDNPRMLRGKNLHAPFADGTCDGCHRPPFGNRMRLRARGEKLCEACHGDLAAAGVQGGSVHRALSGERGRAGCLNCHDPHMGDQPRLVLEPGPRLCGTCHPDIVEAASAETGHFVAAEDCTSCHAPHASAHPSLLKEPPPALCTACHDTSDEELGQVHLGASLEALQCTGCHSPHGSGHPKLLAQNLHPPILDGCETCHEGKADELMEDGESSLCLICHQEVGDAAASAPVPHPALEIARCVECHNPHASKQEQLVKLPSGGACTACHEEQAAGPGETGHGVIDLIGCRACHEPHGGSLPKLLRRPGSELCLSCHDPSRPELSVREGTVRLLGLFEVPAETARRLGSLRLSADGQRNHPVQDHRVLGMPTESELKRIDTSFKEELTCLTCHNPHKGRSKGLFRWNASGAQETCQKCHEK